MHGCLWPGFRADLIPLWDGERYGPFPLITCQRPCNYTATAKVITAVVSTPPPPETSPGPHRQVALWSPAFAREMCLLAVWRRTAPDERGCHCWTLTHWWNGLGFDANHSKTSALIHLQITFFEKLKTCLISTLWRKKKSEKFWLYLHTIGHRY